MDFLSTMKAKAKADKRLQNKLDADDDLMMEADAQARKAINKDIAKFNTLNNAADDIANIIFKFFELTSFFCVTNTRSHHLFRSLKCHTTKFGFW